MASIRPRQTSKGEVQDIRYRDADGRQRTETLHGSKLQARKLAAKLETQLAEGNYVDRDQGRITLREWAKEWQATRHHHAGETRRVVDGIIRNHLGGLADRPLGAISQAEVQSWVGERSKVLGPASVGQTYKWVATIFRAAVEAQPPKLARTPCTRIKVPKPERKLVRPIEMGQVMAMADAVPTRYRALVLLAAASGMRFGELAGLTVDRVDFLRKAVLVDRQWTREAKFGDPKSKASSRPIPIDEGTVGMLAAHLEEFPAGPGGHVFWNGRSPLRQSYFSKLWIKARVKAGVGSVTVHDLRHFYASLLIRQGLDIKTVQHCLGHDSARITLDIYGHLWGDSDSRARDAVAAVFREAVA